MLAVLVVVAALTTTSPPVSFQQPQNGRPPITQQEAGSVQGVQKTASGVGASNRNPLYIRAACDHGCGYSDDNKGWWQKLWTDPVAFFTAVLALFTAGLIGVGIFQGILINKQIRLARDEFNVTHRPKLIVRNFQSGIHDLTDMHDGEAVEPIFIVQNIGDSPGKVVEIRSGVLILSAREKLPSDISFPSKEAFNVDLMSGEREFFPANTGYVPTNADFFDIFADTRMLYCLGTVTYVDSGKRRRETGFCRRYIHEEKRWEVVESEYEYAY